MLPRRLGLAGLVFAVAACELPIVPTPNVIPSLAQGEAACLTDMTLDGAHEAVVQGWLKGEFEREDTFGGLIVFFDLPVDGAPTTFAFALEDADGSGAAPPGKATFGQVIKFEFFTWQAGRDPGGASMASERSAEFDLTVPTLDPADPVRIRGTIDCQ